MISKSGKYWAGIISMADKLRLGIIGANWNLIGHLPAWRMLPGIEVAAICTSRQETAEAAARAHDIPKVFWDWRQMIADPDIDLIDAGTHPSLRQDIVLAAMKAGKHIYNANPFTTDMAKARETLAVQRDNGIVAAVDAQFQWIPQFRQMKRMIDEGYIGETYNIGLRLHFHMMRDGEIAYPFTARTGWGLPYYWLGERSSGASVLRNLGGHALHLLLFLFGPVQSVVCDLDTKLKSWHFGDRPDIAPDTADTCNLMLRFASGAMAQLNIGWAVADGRGFEIEIAGSHGRLRAQSPGGFPDTVSTQLWGAQATMRTPADILEQPIAIADDLRVVPGTRVTMEDERPLVFAMSSLFRSLEEGIRTGSPVRPGFDEALAVQQIVEAAELADRERRWIEVATI